MKKLVELASCALFLCISAIAAEAENVVIKTSLGDITVALDSEAAPVTVANFLHYVDDDAFDETLFHRVIAGFMIQGGGYSLDFSEAPEMESIRNEADNGLKNDRGTIAMARMNAIDSAGRQFFINVADNDSLNHSQASCTREDASKAAKLRARGVYKPQTCETFGYAVFGRVIAGMEVVDLIEMTETDSVGMFSDVPITPVLILSVERLPTES